MIVQMLGKSNGCLGAANYRYAQYMPSGLGADTTIVDPKTGKIVKVSQEQFESMYGPDDDQRVIEAIKKEESKFSIADFTTLMQEIGKGATSVIDIVTGVKSKLSPKGQKQLDKLIEQTFMQKYGPWMVGGGILLAVLIIVMATKKRRRR